MKNKETTLSDYEITKIKEGVNLIVKQVPQATLDEIIRMFNHVFGSKLDDNDRIYAEELIKKEFVGALN